MTTDWIQTACGHRFSFSDIEHSKIDIVDIAVALSRICRFGGHCTDFYSVAQHSVLVSRHVPEEYRLHGLLHDATEAYLGDMTRPLKQIMPEYKQLEQRVEAHILQHFGLGRLPDCVKAADDVMLATERRDLMVMTDDEWSFIRGVTPLRDRIRAWTPEFAASEFLHEFAQITGYKG